MTKRVRGAARTHRRPGARPASERGAAAARRRSSTVAPAGPLEAAQETATYVVEERPAEPAAEPEQTSRTVHARQRAKAGSLLATRAATEYVYVAKDMRRILLVASSLVGVMIVLWLLLVVMRVVPLPFY